MPGHIHSIESQKFYEEIGALQRCLSILRDGFRLTFINENLPNFWWRNNASVHKNFNFAKKKIEEWVRDKYVEEVQEKPAHISPLSVATRTMLTDKVKLRLCLDASYINDLMLTESSKLPNLELHEGLINKDDWMTTLDLANCYFHVRLHEKDHDKVAFAFPKSASKDETEYNYYVIKILVYGLKPASLIISILTKPLMDHLARRNIRATIFIDDIRANNASKEKIEEDTKKIKNVFTKAGWTFNEEKETPPDQSVYYLGFHYDSRTHRYKVHDNKFNQIERRINELKPNEKVLPTDIASIIGKLIAFELATSYVPRLCCHQYFNWIARVIEDREHCTMGPY